MLTGSAMAQGVKLGIDGGLNLANLASQWEGETVSGQIKVGANLGVFANIPLGSAIAIQPGIRYSLKGSKYDSRQTVFYGTNLQNTYEAENNLALHYAEIPLNFVYTFGSDDSRSKFFVGLGPYVAFLLDAEEKFKIKDKANPQGAPALPEDGISDLKIGNDEGRNNLKRTDYGGQAFVGYKLNNSWFLKAGGQMGFEEIRYEQVQNAGFGESFQRNNFVFFLNVGYMFGGGKAKTEAN